VARVVTDGKMSKTDNYCTSSPILMLEKSRKREAHVLPLLLILLQFRTRSFRRINKDCKSNLIQDF